MNRAEVLEQMAPIMGLKARPVEHGPRTRVTVSPDGVEIVHNRHGYHLGDSGVKSLLGFTGLPLPLATGLRPRTLESALTELLAGKGHYTLVTSNDEVTGITGSTDFHGVDPERALVNVERSIPNVDYHRVNLLNSGARVEILGPRQEAVRVGDNVQAGVSVALSPIGTINPQIQSFNLRLVCTNGAIATQVVETFQFGRGGGEGDNIWQWFRQSSKAAYDSFTATVDGYKALAERVIPVGDRAATLEGMIRQAGLTGNLGNTVRGWAVDDPPETEWDIFNLITRASSHLLENSEGILRAQRAAASFSSEAEHRRVCPSCRRQR